eukprot:CAMPEP_0118944212 /NCGR_PEP_ID=MMETSP1169-20130426/39872_1 /TAXON_ID=36882 /ORGANISM="Pyramimonas obovata, Strain CCMP722" /LENGTH=33 /DNA_ID= /DNA_START= /DNA_END= /DNA_ORIENTATION=
MTAARKPTTVMKPAMSPPVVMASGITAADTHVS